MRAYFSRWRQPTRRDLAAAIVAIAVLAIGAAWGIHEMQKRSDEAQKAKYESCLREAEARHVLPFPSLDEIAVCKHEAGFK